MSAARYVMIGGFLGAGKTTAVAQFAKRYSAEGLRVGLITNDQGSNLVDTAMLRSRGFATEEIPGGCFCCRFNSLMEAAQKLTESARPDVFIAEPVGSCTDLVATVTYPLRRIYGANCSVSPLSVLVDPVRAMRVLELESGGAFSPKVRYIYRKQLEEADLIVINKRETIDASALDKLRAALGREFPEKQIVAVSARLGDGMVEWFEAVNRSLQPSGASMEVDYETYAEGEALLGWLNATVQASAAEEFDANELLRSLAMAMQKRLAAAGAEIAHLKMTFSPDQSLGEIAGINVVRNEVAPELGFVLDQHTSSGQLIINLRAEAAPETLRACVEEALVETGGQAGTPALALEHLEHFRPGKPQPTYRDMACAVE